jgi:UDP-N-acetylglucosamine 2-epimerase (non-hydrolysing)
VSLLVIVGTRPEIIKMTPVIKELEKRNLEFLFVHTGQHYDYEMSELFIEELDLPMPCVSFKLENSSPGAQIGEMMLKLDKTLMNVKKKNRILLVEGDTNSIVASALTGIKMGLKIGHVEAGLRSYDWRMPEEHNRRLVDHISDYLFAPTEYAMRNLNEEHVHGEIYVTGNTVIDAVDIYFSKVVENEPKVIEQLKFSEYGLVTFHRAENVEDPVILRNFVMILEKSPIPLVYPIHPRTKKRLCEQGLLPLVESLQHVQLLSPQGYFEFLALMKNSKIILTDSGGLQEEATHPKIRKPVLILRKTTERPEAIKTGFARIVDVNPIIALTELEKALSESLSLPTQSPFGDGKASKRIIDIILSKLENMR